MPLYSIVYPQYSPAYPQVHQAFSQYKKNQHLPEGEINNNCAKEIMTENLAAHLKSCDAPPIRVSLYKDLKNPDFTLLTGQEYPEKTPQTGFFSFHTPKKRRENSLLYDRSYLKMLFTTTINQFQLIFIPCLSIYSHKRKQAP